MGLYGTIFGHFFSLPRQCLFFLVNQFQMIGLNQSLILEKTNPTPIPQPDLTGDKLFLRQIILDFHKTFRISSKSSINMICDVKDDPILHVSNQEPSINVPQAPNLGYLSQIMSDLHQTFRISSKSSINMIYDFKCDTIIQVSNQEPSTSSKPSTYASSAKSYRISTKHSGYLQNQLSR